MATEQNVETQNGMHTQHTAQRREEEEEEANKSPSTKSRNKSAARLDLNIIGIISTFEQYLQYYIPVILYVFPIPSIPQ